MVNQVIKSLLFLIFISFLGIGITLGQDTDTSELEELKKKVESQKPGKTTFLMRGYSHAGFEVIDNKSSFVSGTFAPIFLWRQSDKILYEAEAEIAYGDDGVSFALEYANISYILNDYFIVRFGNFLTPFGIFGERLHPNWINRFPTNPIGFDHHNPVGPFAEFGVELRGGAPLGNTQINYAVYISNGPSLHVDTDTDPLVVNTSYQNFDDNNDNKAIGGRIGILPFSNASLELGASVQYAGIGDRDTPFEDINSFMYAVDLTYVKNSISAIKGSIDLKSQWNYVDEDRFQLIDPENNITEVDNDKSAYFVMFSYRPTLSGSTLLSNLEMVVRYSSFDIINEASFIAGEGDGHTHKVLSASPYGSTPSVSAVLQQPEHIEESHGSLAEDQTQWAFGLNYWLTWRSVLKFSYQVTDNEDDIPGFFIHYALGF